MTEDLDDLLCPPSAAGRPERFHAKACVLAGECGCAYGAEWSRAIRLADDAAESVICTNGHNTEGRPWVLYPEQIAADPYLDDCIAHLEWRGIAKVVREDDGRVTVIFDAMEAASAAGRCGMRAPVDVLAVMDADRSAVALRSGVGLMRWLGDIHVIPRDDFRDHEETEHCWCRPRRDDEEPRVVIHNALDGREGYENGRKWH